MVPILLVAACSGGDRSDRSPRASVPGKAFGDSMVIRSTDGRMKLGLTRDTVFMGLTDSVLAAARADMARDTEEKSSAFAGRIEQFMKRSVSSALRMKLKYPLTDLDSAVYSDGRIKFAYRNRRTMAFENVTVSGHKALESFNPADAQKFVNLVNSAIREERTAAPSHP